MKLLILGTTIIATGDLAETDAEIRTADAIYPKHVIAGYEIIEAELPEGFHPARYDYRDGALVNKPATAEEIQAAKAVRKGECDRLANAKRDLIVASVSPAEMASWAIKRAEAIVWQAKGAAASDADAPNLVTEATARGILISELVGKVLTKAGQLAMLEAQIAGVCGKHQDALSTMTTVAAIEAYDIKAGWPV